MKCSNQVALRWRTVPDLVLNRSSADFRRIYGGLIRALNDTKFDGIAAIHREFLKKYI